MALNTGMRRGELANLQARDIHEDFLVARQGKNKKDRVIPFNPDIANRLHAFVKGKDPDEKVFGLGGPSLTMLIKKIARRAGIEDLHAHTLRHKFVTDLLESGANIKVVQQLMGHDNLNTTQVYLSVTDQGVWDAINKLG